MANALKEKAPVALQRARMQEVVEEGIDKTKNSSWIVKGLSVTIAVQIAILGYIMIVM
jgi:hypothetical protein